MDGPLHSHFKNQQSSLVTPVAGFARAPGRWDLTTNFTNEHEWKTGVDAMVIVQGEPDLRIVAPCRRMFRQAQWQMMSEIRPLRPATAFWPPGWMARPPTATDFSDFLDFRLKCSSERLPSRHVQASDTPVRWFRRDSGPAEFPPTP